MSTLEKASSSVRRRRASLGTDPRTPATPAVASPSFARRSSAPQPPPPEWDDRINVEEQAPAKANTQSTVTPAGVSVTPSDADLAHWSTMAKAGKTSTKVTASSKPPTPADGNSNNNSKTREVKEASTGEGAAKKISKTATTGAKQRPSLTLVSTEDSATSLSSTPMLATRSTVFTATSTAVSQQRGDGDSHHDRHPSPHARQGSLHEASEDGWRSSKVRDIDSSESSNNINYSKNDKNSSGGVTQKDNASHATPRQQRHAESAADLIELDVSSQTSSNSSSSHHNSDFDFQMQETPMGAATSTSRALSSAAALPSLPPTSASAEGADWVRVSSQQVSQQEDAPTTGAVALPCPAGPVTPVCSVSNSSFSSPSSPPPPVTSTTPPPPPPRDVSSEEDGEPDGRSANAVTAAAVDGGKDDGGVDVSALKENVRKAPAELEAVFESSSNNNASPSSPAAAAERRAEKTPAATPTTTAPTAETASSKKPARRTSETNGTRREDMQKANKEKVDSPELSLHPAPADEAAVHGEAEWNGNVAKEEEVKAASTAAQSAATSTDGTPPAVVAAATAPAEEEKKSDGVGVEAACSVEQSTTMSASPLAKAPSMRLPRYMTGTSARPVVGLTPASSTAASPVRSISRARARLASTDPLQQRRSASLRRSSQPPPPPQKLTVSSPALLSPLTTQVNPADTSHAGMMQRTSSMTSPGLQAVSAASSASSTRFSRTSSLAEPSSSESSVARRRARRAAMATAAMDSNKNSFIHRSSVAASTSSPSWASTLRRSNSEPINVRRYEEQQKRQGRFSRDSSVASARRGAPAVAAAASLASRSSQSVEPQPQQQQPVLSFDLMDRCIYQAVMVDPPSINERMSMPPVMERPLSYYEQGMYNRHKENAPAHYKKALLHEQRALLRNTAWLPVSRILDQRSGGVGAMMMDDFRHMARVIRYVQEMENWRAALTQQAKYEARCAELVQAAARRSGTVLTNSLKSVSGSGSPKAASPSVHRDNGLVEGVYDGVHADARATSMAAVALDDPNAKASPPLHKPVLSPATAAETTMSTAEVPRTPTPATSVAACKSSLHNPDYSDSDVDEDGKPISKIAEVPQQQPAFAKAHMDENAPSPHSAHASSPSPSAKRPTMSGHHSAAAAAAAAAKKTAVGAASTTTSTAAKKTKKTEEKSKSHAAKNKEKDKDKKKKDKTDAPTFLSWLADTFGVKKNKKEGKDTKPAKEEKEKLHAHHKAKADKKPSSSSSPTATKDASGKSKSVAKPDTSLEGPKIAPPSVLVKHAAGEAKKSTTSATTKASSEPALSKQWEQERGSSTAKASTQPAAASAPQKSLPNAASPLPYSLTTKAAPTASAAAAATTTMSMDASSSFTEDLHLSRFQERNARCCSVELPRPPVPVFRLYNFHPLEVVQELKRMVWWAATHRFPVFRVLTGTTASAAAAVAMEEDEDDDGDGTSFSMSTRRRRQRGDDPPYQNSDSRGRRNTSSSLSTSPMHDHDDGARSSSSTPTLDDSPSPSWDSLDNSTTAYDNAGAQHEAVYFNTVLLNLRIDRWLLRHVVLTRRDAARGLVELETTEVTEAEAADAALRDEEMAETMAQRPSSSHSRANTSVADRQMMTAMTYFFNADTRTPR